MLGHWPSRAIVVMPSDYSEAVITKAWGSANKSCCSQSQRLPSSSADGCSWAQNCHAIPTQYAPGPYYYPVLGYGGGCDGDAARYCMQRFRSCDPGQRDLSWLTMDIGTRVLEPISEKPHPLRRRQRIFRFCTAIERQNRSTCSPRKWSCNLSRSARREMLPWAVAAI